MACTQLRKFLPTLVSGNMNPERKLIVETQPLSMSAL